MLFDQLKRRTFITLLGGAAAWPLAARAQQPAKLPTIGFLGTATPSMWSHWVAAFVQRLREHGLDRWTQHCDRISLGGGTHRTFRRDRGRVGQTESGCHRHVGRRSRRSKAGYVGDPDGFPMAPDPVSSGLVASLARPGGNVTGLSIQSTELATRRLELIREVVPGLRRLAIMGNAGSPAAVLEMSEVQAAARKLGLEVEILEIRRAEDIAPDWE